MGGGPCSPSLFVLGFDSLGYVDAVLPVVLLCGCLVHLLQRDGGSPMLSLVCEDVDLSACTDERGERMNQSSVMVTEPQMVFFCVCFVCVGEYCLSV